MASLVLSACTTDVVPVTPSLLPDSTDASPSASALPSARTPELPLATAVPGALGSGSGAQVDAKNLAVRTGPGTSFPLVAGYRLDPATQKEVLISDGVRLDAGYLTSVVQGPLVIDGIHWYLISPERQPGETVEHSWRWDADRDGVNSDPGWVAGITPDETFLIPRELPPCINPDCFPGIPPAAVLYATGSARSMAFEMASGVFVEWYAADPSGQACDFRIRLRPQAIVLDSARVVRLAHGQVVWPFDLQQPPSATEGASWLEVESDCTWSLIASHLQ
jgi:hypothetical protein